MAPALAALRAAEVLRHVARHPGEPLTLTALATRLAVSPAAMHAVLDALVQSGFLERNEKDRTFRLGPESVVLGSAARQQLDDVALAAAAASRIADTHALRASVLARRGEEILVLDGVGEQGLGLDLEIPGNRVVFAAPLGAVFASRLPHHGVVAWFQRAGIDPASPLAERYRAELERIADRGWSLGSVSNAIDPDRAWVELIDPGGSDAARPWHYLVDDLDCDDSLHMLTPTVIVVDCAIDGVTDLAVAVTGFDQPLACLDARALAASLVHTARRRSTSGPGRNPE